MRQLIVVALIAALAASGADAWWCTGHMTIAQIAKTTMSASAVSAVETIVENLSKEGPFPKSPDMMQTACWADDIKGMSLTSMRSWHFINQPYDPTHYLIKQNPVQEENVESVIEQLNGAAKRNTADKDGWVVGFAVANLIHFYGDIHQPLHVTELFSSTYPTGDHGGNEEVVHVDGTETKLHFIWDSICWEYNKEMDRPLSAADASIVTNLAQRLMSTYSFTPAQKKEFNSTVMAQEGLSDAINYAYPGIYNGITITQAYLTRCIPVAEARVALAGYRLGSQLEYMFSSFGHDSKLLASKIKEHIAAGVEGLSKVSAARHAALKTKYFRK